MTFLDGFFFGWGFIVAGITGFFLATIVVNIFAMLLYRGD